MALPALIALGQAGYSLYQANKQKKMADNLKPSNYVPPSVKEAVNASRIGAANTVAPGYGRLMDKLKSSTENTIARTSRLTTNSGRIQQSVADADAREKEVIKDMEVNNEMFRNQNRNQMANLLGVQGGYEKASMDAYNATKSALTGASMQNKYNAITSLGENLIYAGAMKGTPKKIKIKNDITGEKLEIDPSELSKYQNEGPWKQTFFNKLITG